MAGIFKAYDIRGIVEPNGPAPTAELLSPHVAYLIGRGLAATVFSGASPILVSRDMRTHSPEMSRELARGLSEGGCEVLDIGLAATPMNYWANVNYKAAGSVTVTASHNGPEYNGFKVSGAGAVPLDHAAGLNATEAWVRAALAEGVPTAGPAASVREIEGALSAYLDWMDGFFTIPVTRSLRIAIDTANGMGGFFLSEWSARHPQIELVPLYWDLDGTFPNHEADPLKAENLHDVERAVREHNCDIGVAFDGDADRCMFVDETGTSISSDLITAFVAGKMLRENPGAAILYDLRSSRAVPESISEQGGRPVRGRVGHSFMKRLLRENNAPFGGELSGHYYFRDCFNTDSGLMALIQVIQIWAAGTETLSQNISSLHRYRATGEINFRVDDVAAAQKRIESHYLEQGATSDHLDGLTIEFADWWFNLRSSNTEPLLRLNLEAADEASRDTRLTEVTALIGGKKADGGH